MGNMLNSNKKIVSFPQMGNISIAVSSLFRKMGANVLLAPPNNKETLSIGTRNSSETVCLPYKLNLGNYIQALDAGANVLIMFQAPGTCRLGNYASAAEAKLKELGYDFEMVVFDMYKGKLIEIAKKFSHATGCTSLTKTLAGVRLGFAKFDALDTIERNLFYFRPREVHTGTAEKIYLSARNAIDRTLSVRTVKDIVRQSVDKFNSIEVDKNKTVLKAYLTGEFFVLLDPFSNMEIEKELGLLGVEVERQVMLSDWTNNVLLPNFINNKESHRTRSMRVAGEYMTRAIGGDCIESIADTVYASKKNIDGVVHIGPFNCNPEIVSQCILPHVSKQENIPVISLIMDEQTGKAGLITRLEAFVDLIHRRKRAKITA